MNSEFLQEFCFQRLPDDTELRVRQFEGQVHMLEDFTAEFYFNPIAPISDQGEPPGNVVVSDLRLHRSGIKQIYN